MFNTPILHMANNCARFLIWSMVIFFSIRCISTMRKIKCTKKLCCNMHYKFWNSLASGAPVGRITLRENLCVNSTWTWSSCDAYPSSNVNIQLPQMFQFKNSEALSRTLRSAGAPRPGRILLYPNFTPPKITTLTFPGDTISLLV